MEKFLEFQRALQNEILRLEFYRKTSGNTVREKEFADLLIAYAGFPAKKKARMLKRVKKAFHSDDNRGITIEDFLNFYQVTFSQNIKKGNIFQPKCPFQFFFANGVVAYLEIPML